MVFPFDFGFVPGTQAPDGDPLDVLVLMDAPVYPGCVVLARPIGMLACEQRELRHKAERNDRLLAVADVSPSHRDIRSINDLGAPLLRALEAFFTDYQRLSGREFKVLRRQGAGPARQAIKRAQATARRADTVA
jgi:inorganic pyrophosphatase